MLFLHNIWYVMIMANYLNKYEKNYNMLYNNSIYHISHIISFVCAKYGKHKH